MTLDSNPDRLKIDLSIDSVIQEGHGKIRTIFRTSERLKSTAVMKKVWGVCIQARRIYDLLEKKPHLCRMARPFLVHYMDAFREIVEGYEKHTSDGGEGGAVENSIRRAGKLIGVLGESFEKLLENLSGDDLLALDAEMKVLETALKSEGLA